MEQNKNNIDKYFRDGLADFEATPPAEVWEHIQDNMPRKKRKPIFFWWTLSLVAAGGLGFFTNAFLHQQSNETHKLATIQAVATSHENQVSSKKIFSGNDNSTINNDIPLNKDGANSLQTEAYKENNNTGENVKPYKSQLSTQNNISKNIVFEQQNVTLQKNDVKKEGISLFERNFEADFAINTVQTTPNNTEFIEKDNSINALPIVQGKVVSAEIKTPSIIPLVVTDEISKNIIVPIKAKPKWAHAVELNAGLTYNQAKFSSKSAEKDNYATLRDTSEKYKIGYDFGVQYNAVHRSGIGLRTGVQVTQWVEHLHNENKLYTNRMQKVAQYRSKQGTVAYSDTATQILRGKLIQDFYNRYTAIDIPIQVGFEFQKSPSLEYFFYGGALVNILFAADGDILAANRSVVSYPKQKVYKSSTGIGLMANVGLRKKISKHLWVITGLQSSMNLDNILVKENVLKQKNIKTGIQVGFRYQF